MDSIVLFTANRTASTSDTPAVLSTAARHVIFQEDHHMTNTTTTGMTGLAPEDGDVAEADAAVLRAQLVDTIAGYGVFDGPDSPVQHAFSTVPRHVFLPDVPLLDAYASRAVVTKRAADGSALSSASAPMLVARMLEQLDVQAGDRVLEIGAATGFNATLLAELVGPHGHVVTIEYDRDLADGAAAAISRAG